MKKKILIIKLGFSETLDPEIGMVPSLGDVLRTTPMLWALREKFPDSHISWLVSKEAEPLLNGNPFIDRILVWDSFVPFQLMRENFDILINLEKISGVCALADTIDAWTKYGFRFDSHSGSYSAYERGLNFISYIEEKKTRRPKQYWQQVLVEMLGVPWQAQKYILGYQPKTDVTFDVGFNFEVGKKWPVKALPMDDWKTLEQRLLASGLTVTWQEGRQNLKEYMDWIHSSRVLISNDSLGLHLALALDKNVIGLFGPTDPSEVFFYGRGHAIQAAAACSYLPCYSTKCLSDMSCMSQFNIGDIEKVLSRILVDTSAPKRVETVAMSA